MVNNILRLTLAALLALSALATLVPAVQAVGTCVGAYCVSVEPGAPAVNECVVLRTPGQSRWTCAGDDGVCSRNYNTNGYSWDETCVVRLYSAPGVVCTWTSTNPGTCLVYI
jgi:hypothetical protein